MINVYFAVNESGVNYWRGKVPGWALKRKGLANVNMLNIYDYSPEQVEKEVSESNVIYMPCATGIETLIQITAYLRNKQAVVVDYDDNLFDTHPYNPAYATLGLYPVTITNSDGSVVELWKDQRHGFSLEDNRKRYYAHVDILNTANQITVTTEKLKGTILDQCSRDESFVNIIPNAIDFNVFKPFGKRVHSKDKIRIGWAASDSHIVEGRYVMRVINELKLRRSDFEFIILGNIEKLRWVEKESNFNVEWHEFTDLSVYPLKLASLNLDIGIIPLENHSFNLSKSALKWSEYSAMMVPSVVSNLAPYDCVEDGVTGMKANSEIEMVDKICELMDSPQKRAEITLNAYEKNRQDFNIDTVCLKWLEVFERAYMLPHKVLYKNKPLEEFHSEPLNFTGLPLNVRRELNVR